jgi:hypothetical protein
MAESLKLRLPICHGGIRIIPVLYKGLFARKFSKGKVGGRIRVYSPSALLHRWSKMEIMGVINESASDQ